MLENDPTCSTLFDGLIGYSLVATEDLGDFDGMIVPFLIGNPVDDVSSLLPPATGGRVRALENDSTCSTLFDGLVGYSLVATEDVGEFDGMTVPFLVGNAVNGVSLSLLPATGDRVGVLENDSTCSTLSDGLVGCSLVSTEDVGEFDGMTVPFLVGNSVDDVSSSLPPATGDRVGELENDSTCSTLVDGLPVQWPSFNHPLLELRFLGSARLQLMDSGQGLHWNMI